MNTMNLSRKAEAGIILAAAALLFFAGCKEKPRAAPPPPLVEVTPVTQADVPVYHDWIGTLDGLVNATIRAQVTGYLLTQDYREGDAIKKGDLLFQIDPRPFQAVLDQANGQLAQTEARLGKTELDVKRYAPLVKTRPSARRNTMTPSRPIWRPRPPFCPPKPKWNQPS